MIGECLFSSGRVAGCRDAARRLGAIALAVPLLLAALLAPPAARAAPGDAEAVPAAPFDLDDQARIDAGRKRFNQTCAAYCHGAGGEGGKAPNFKGRPDFSPPAAYDTIVHGRNGGADVMPPWGSAFSGEQIWELVAYLKLLSTQEPTR